MRPEALLEDISLVLRDIDENKNKIHMVNGGHLKSFCVGVLEVIKSSKCRNSKVKPDAALLPLFHNVQSLARISSGQSRGDRSW